MSPKLVTAVFAVFTAACLAEFVRVAGDAVAGPTARTMLVAGFWLLNAKSLDEVIDWMKRAPFLAGDEIEIRQVFAAEDFGEALTPELREQEERLRAQAGKR